MIRAIVFDLDGTLLNTLDDLCDSLNFAMDACQMPRHSLEKTRQMVGNGTEDLLTRAVPGGRQNPRFDECISVYRARYTEHWNDKTRPYDGILPLLRTLKEKGIGIGVASNKFDAAVKELVKLHFGDLVDIAIGEGGEIGKKPKPDSVYAAMKVLGVTPDEILYAGDSDTDMETGKNAGVFTVGVLWGFRDEACMRKAGGEHFISHPEEILKYIEM